ncbi:MAG: tetratricopeptide repeat protein [Bacteroidetes bacterium]|nr:tetratricopeptide repeat protein [Bacteroidota bacterium]
MKKSVLLIIFFSSTILLHAQDGDQLKKHYLKTYTQSLSYNDVNSAIGALQGYLAIDKAYNYLDTLSMLYFSVKNYYSALLTSEEVYKADAKNLEAMARTAECYDELGDPKTATGLFEQVVPKIRNPFYAYKLAVCQYQIKRTAESEASAKIVLADTLSRKIGVPFTTISGQEQNVSVAAAAANLIGVMRLDVKNYAEAKKYFEQALALFPDFAGAKDNLAAIERLTKGAKTTPATKSPAKRN